MEKFYKISEAELIELLIDSLHLSALKAGGVDNWCGYGDSIRDFLEKAIKEEGLKLEEGEDFSLSDLVQFYLKDYSKVQEL